MGAAAMLLAGGTGWSLSTWRELVVVDTASSGPPATAPPNAFTTPDGSTTVPTTIQPGQPNVPACTIDDQPVVGDPAAEWATVVVDATYALPADFEPPDLVDVSAAGFNTDDQIREIVVPDLNALRQAAEDAGTPLSMVSAYRSHTYQEGLFTGEVEDRGLEEAQRTTARPGHSEHQLGTAVDLTDAEGAPLDETFADSETALWLAENAHQFGFVISYPNVEAERTCYQYEPWHLRYVGHDLAAMVHNSGLTLREWLLSQ